MRSVALLVSPLKTKADLVVGCIRKLNAVFTHKDQVHLPKGVVIAAPYGVNQINAAKPFVI